MDTTIRLMTRPLLQLCEEVFETSSVGIFGDNPAMLCILKTGRNPTMRHLSRTHRVSVAWLHEQYQRENFVVSYVRSCDMAADIFTKSIPNPEAWRMARMKINVLSGIQELIDSISATCDKPCIAPASRETFVCVAI